MAEGSLLCAQVSCKRPASRFGFVEGTSKLAVCPEHLSTLSVQGVSTFEIAAYGFMDRVEDYSVYQQRAAQAVTGLKNVIALEERCDFDLNGILKTLATVKCSKAVEVDICLHSEQYCKAMKQRLREVRLHLGKLVKDREITLSVNDAFLYEMPPGPVFRVEQGEKGAFYLELTNIGVKLVPALAELVTLRVTVSRSGRESWRAAKTIVSQFSSQATQSEVQAVAEGYVRGAVEAREVGNYAKTLKKLQKGRAILQQWGLESGLLCMHMGEVQAYYGEWTEAETELKKGLDYQMSVNPTSELAVQLSNSLVEHYHQRDMLEETMEQAKWTLRTFGDTGHAFELLRAFYFVSSELSDYFWKSLDGKELALVKQWTEELAASPQCLLLCLRAQQLESCRMSNESALAYEQALKLRQQFPAYSYLTTLAKFKMGFGFGSNDQAYTAYKKGLQTFMAHFPQSKSAFYYFDWAFRYSSMSQQPDEIYSVLLSFYSTQFPQSLGHAYCLSRLAGIAADMNTFSAQQYYQEAKTIFSTRFPNTSEYACHLTLHQAVFNDTTTEELNANLQKFFNIVFARLPRFVDNSYPGLVITSADHLETERLYMKVYEIYMTCFPHSPQFPCFLKYFGDFYRVSTHQDDKALEKYQQAYQICLELFPTSLCFSVIMDLLALHLETLGRLQDAVEVYMKVCEPLETEDDQSLFHTYLLYKLGILFAKNDDPQADIYFEKACQILSPQQVHSKYYVRCLQERARYIYPSNFKQAESYCLMSCLFGVLRINNLSILSEFYEGKLCSSDENLEEVFNSLAINKEASEACYVRLQSHCEYSYRLRENYE